MVFGNFNYISLILFIFIILLGGIFLRGIYLKQKNIISIILLSFCLLFLIINIFEIKGGFDESVDRVEGGKVVFVLDVSKSMDVEDIKNDKIYFSRLVASKDFIKQYVEKNINNYYGLMIFAGETQEVLPFINNSDIFSTILYGVNNKNISKFGTNLNSVFSALENYFVSDNDGGLVVIFSDLGDEKIEINKEQLKILNNKGIKLLLIGVGTEEGGKIPDGIDFFGRKIYKYYNGSEVISRLNTSELKNISSSYNIDNIMLKNNDHFIKISDNITKNIKKIELEKHIYNRLDLTRFFVFISFILFILFLYTDNFIGKQK